ncbi:MAG: hypothetical protein IJD77_04150 [Clostridia bacterium]|nr:hypothetical protein [Clostridia bacterium]
MKKMNLAKLLGLTCALCFVGGGVAVSNVNTVSAEEASTLVADAEWMDPWGTGAQMMYDTATGTSYVRMTSWGQRAYNVNKVKLDGLKVTMASTQHASGHCFGFGFTGNTNNDYTLSEMTTVNVTWRAYQYDGQNRLYVNSNHDNNANNGTICYKDQALTNNSAVFGLDQSFVATATKDDAYSFTFDLVMDNEGTDTDVWSVTIDVVRGDKFDGQTTPCTVYFSGAKMVNILDANGECYVSAWGMENAGAFSLTLEDDNLKAYKEKVVPAVDTAVAEYIAAANGASDLAGFQATMEKRAALETAIATLRGNDKLAYNAKLAEGDAIVAAKQDTVKGIVSAKYDKVDAKVAVFEDESAITADGISAAAAELENANSVYASVKALLNNENQLYFDSLATDYAYELTYAKACIPVLECENKVAGLENLAEAELLAVIAETRETYANYVGSEMEGLINALNETDKAAMEARLMAIVEAAEAAATAQKNLVEEKYTNAKTSVEALEAEATEELLANAKAALADANAKYALVQTLFTEEEQSTYAAAALDYETRIAAVEETMEPEVPVVPGDSEEPEVPVVPGDSEEPEVPVDPEVSEQPEQPEVPEKEDKKKDKSGCGNTIGGISAVITLAGAAVLVLKKKD